jgi:hypothetical protein
MAGLDRHHHPGHVFQHGRDLKLAGLFNRAAQLHDSKVVSHCVVSVPMQEKEHRQPENASVAKGTGLPLLSELVSWTKRIGQKHGALTTRKCAWQKQVQLRFTGEAPRWPTRTDIHESGRIGRHVSRPKALRARLLLQLALRGRRRRVVRHDLGAEPRGACLSALQLLLQRTRSGAH